MDDLGKPISSDLPSYGLGGGNPARITEVEQAYRRQLEKMLADGDAFEQTIARYDAPQGRMEFVHAVAAFLSKTYGWQVEDKNIAITNGSQSAMFYLFNLLAGPFDDGCCKTVLFPLMPEYIGYADQGIFPDMFVSVPSVCTYFPDHTFKYAIDFPAVENYLELHCKAGIDGQVGALCVTRPTNPSGNVLTDAEINRLSDLAAAYDIPLVIDNAYGVPFPNIVFTADATPIWNEHIILSMSLSKIGLPSVRTGIVVAAPQIIEDLSNINAIAALASGSMGQALAGPMIESGELVRLADDFVQPFYARKSLRMQQYIRKYFAGMNYCYHRSEGSIFIWLCLPDLSIPTKEFYKVLKDHGVITVPGEYSFFGHEDQKHGLPYPHPHFDKCLRLNYAGPDKEVEDGVRLIAEIYGTYCSK
jgi:valine--pyruvate aminotransferase